MQVLQGGCSKVKQHSTSPSWFKTMQPGSDAGMQTHLAHYLGEKTACSTSDSAGLCVQWKELDKYAINVSSHKTNQSCAAGRPKSSMNGFLLSMRTLLLEIERFLHVSLEDVCISVKSQDHPIVEIHKKNPKVMSRFWMGSLNSIEQGKV